jgi:hypothetical protein
VINLLNALLPGLAVAVTPALLTIAWQMAANHRDTMRLRRERLTQAFLDFRSEAELLSGLAIFTDAHAGAVADSKNSIAIWVGLLQPFDLTHFGDRLIDHTTRFARLGNELVALVQREETQRLVNAAASATHSLLETYMSPTDRRSALQKLRTSRASPDMKQVMRKREEFNLAFSALALALAEPRRSPLRTVWP